MKAVLMSVKPRWWKKMLSGEKDLEIRKTAPAGKEIPWPFLVLVYVSGTKAVQGQFLCPGMLKTDCPREFEKRSCVPAETLEKYAAGKSLCGWIIDSPEKYDTPSPLAEFGLERPPMSWQYVEIPDVAEDG